MYRPGYRVFWCAAFVGFCLLLQASAAWGETYYRIIEMTPFPGATLYRSHATCINDAGQVGGHAKTASDETHGFRYTNGVMIDLGGFIPCDINESGLIVGGANGHAALYVNATVRDLGTLSTENKNEVSVALGINDVGQIVGVSDTDGPSHPHAFLYENNSMTDLNDLAVGLLGRTLESANDINNLGQIVGQIHLSSGHNHPFLFDNGVVIDLGNFGGPMAFANSINEGGQVVGQAQTAYPDFHYRAFLYENGTMSDLGTLGGAESSAYAINDHGQIVGYADVAGSTIGRPFLYDNGVMIDLNDLLPTDSEWELRSPADINNLGQIVGNGRNPDGAEVGFLLNPCVPGDANEDEKVDGVDLAYWQQSYDPLGEDSNTWAMGDWNLNGKIDGGDLALWQQNYDPIGPGGLGGTEPIPEPTTALYLLMGAGGFGAWFGRRQRRR